MALLNFATTYEEIEGFLDTPEASNGDFVKLFFSKDGHIISHGKDFLQTFTHEKRGLVPESTSIDPKKILRANATWAEIKTTDLPIAELTPEDLVHSAQYNSDDYILNVTQVYDFVTRSFLANDAMRYVGTIEYADGTYSTTTEAGTTLGFPTKCNVGDTYRVKTSGTYAGYECSTGDLLIAIKDSGSASNINLAEYWTAVEANINGYTTYRVNGSPYELYTTRPDQKFTIFAPTTGGTQSEVLISQGDTTPIWVPQSELRVGTANKVQNALTLRRGLRFDSGDSFDGSAARELSLVPATRKVLGGVIVDRDNKDTKKTISVDTDGNIYLTHDNVANALGYDPVNVNTWRPITIGGQDIGTRTLNIVPTGDVYLKTDANGDDIEDISFGLSWFNISANGGEGAYETAPD